ncbi:MAG: tRNA uridine-5-carboxymethylaminomethyl(34) synthesis GTPase MnmE [Lachnospiraceae bacterium]
MKTDTIAAIATGLSDSGIGIIRVSGQEAIQIVDSIYWNANKKQILRNYPANTIHYGFIHEEDEIVDEVMVSVFHAPYSYTTEDIVEINCHGGIYLLRKVLMMVLDHGARLAEPGEFTKRAFLNGRIDLARAEAVMDMISAQNHFSLQSSIRQLRGDVSQCIRSLREKLIYEIAFIESALDDPEHISLDGYPEKLDEILQKMEEELHRLLVHSQNGSILKNGINTVILGKPNAGKSSLLNQLAGKERSIVTEIAGTTRDIIEETVRLGEVTLNMIDTAGIRDTEDKIEQIGVEKAIQYAEDADFIIYVVDSSVSIDDNDRRIIPILQNRNAVVLCNKSDLNQAVSEDEIHSVIGEGIRIIHTSTKDGSGLEELEQTVEEMFFRGEVYRNDEIYMTNIRHREAMEEAYNSIGMVRSSIRMNMPEDFFAIDLMNAYRSLGLIIGEEVEDDLVNEIFSKFCMGK